MEGGEGRAAVRPLTVPLAARPLRQAARQQLASSDRHGLPVLVLCWVGRRRRGGVGMESRGR